MASLRVLAGQTAIYGMSSIIGRVLTFLLTPLYTRVFSAGEYGVITELYAYVAFLIVFLTFGMETAFFRFGSQTQDESERRRYFSTAFIAVGTLSAVFLLLLHLFNQPVANALGYGDERIFILYFGWIIALDAIVTIPLARLRMLNKPIPFAGINIASVLAYIALNLFFILYCPYALENTGALGHNLIALHYNPDFGVGYIFLANVMSSGFRFALLLPYLIDLKAGFDAAIMRRLFKYAYPLLILGIAGICNETFDRAFFKDLSPLPNALAEIELGIYGACYKVAMLLSIGIQAYRFAAEPFLFAQTKGLQRDEGQSRIMRYYFVAALFIALSIALFLDLALILIGPEFRAGAGVIPILLLAYVCFGAVFNLSFWYKLNDKTLYGAFIAIAGAVVTVGINIWLVPILSYYGSALATLAAYLVMLALSFGLGQKHYPIAYPLRTIGLYVATAIACFVLNREFPLYGLLKYVSSAFFLACFLFVIIWHEKRYFRDGILARITNFHRF